MQLIVKNVNKKIKGKMILSQINLDLQSGNIYGITGPNGSGKTMLFRALSGLMTVTSGDIILDGKRLKKDFTVLPNLGILLENIALYDSMTGYENLKYLANLNRKIDDEEIRKTLLRVNLNPDDRRKYGKYSLGMKQRLSIAQAVMEKPDILMLDEPSNGLDQESLHMVRQLIKEEKDRGAMVLLASHNKDDIEVLADHVFTMENGKLHALLA